MVYMLDGRPKTTSVYMDWVVLGGKGGCVVYMLDGMPKTTSVLTYFLSTIKSFTQSFVFFDFQ